MERGANTFKGLHRNHEIGGEVSPEARLGIVVLDVRGEAVDELTVTELALEELLVIASKVHLDSVPVQLSILPVAKCNVMQDFTWNLKGKNPDSVEVLVQENTSSMKLAVFEVAPHNLDLLLGLFVHGGAESPGRGRGIPDSGFKIPAISPVETIDFNLRFIFSL